jgi:hypothetical protein
MIHRMRGVVKSIIKEPRPVGAGNFDVILLGFLLMAVAAAVAGHPRLALAGVALAVGALAEGVRAAPVLDHVVTSS